MSMVMKSIETRSRWPQCAGNVNGMGGDNVYSLHKQGLKLYRPIAQGISLKVSSTRGRQRCVHVYSSADSKVESVSTTSTQTGLVQMNQEQIEDNIKFLQEKGYGSLDFSRNGSGAILSPGQPMIEEALSYASVDTKITYQQIVQIFPFELDDFQQKAIKVLVTGENVVVCAPTGAGKTSIAVGAMFRCLLGGQRVIYTTPLKALSNQKYNEFKEIFGEARVGLQTGDVVFNANAQIVVMTTEIFRNQLYREDSQAYMGVVQNIASIGLLVLDEVHYLGDRYRGTVWEEVIINCPNQIQLVAMSATVQNPGDLGEWISSVHKPCQTITTGDRPVPLKFWYSFQENTYKASNIKQIARRTSENLHMDIVSRKLKILPMLDVNNQGLNPLISETVTDTAEVINAIQLKLKQVPNITRVKDPDLGYLMKDLKKKKMLPAIYFLFSRAKCDKFAMELYEQGEEFVTQEEFGQIYSELTKLRAENKDAVRESLVEPMCAGIVSHHAGCLPAWKALTEVLFQRGLVKVVFATETLAAGINMPARTTIISSLARYRDTENQRLTTNEFLQMAGRAGRRGYDTEGNTIVLRGRLSKAKQAGRLLKQGPEPLESQFTASYGMVLNLLYTRSLDQAKEFVQKSFRSFMGYKGDGDLSRRIADIQEDIQELREEARQKDFSSFKQQADQAKSTLKTNQKELDLEIQQKFKEYNDERGKKVKEELGGIQAPFEVAVEVRTGANAINVKLVPSLCFKIIPAEDITNHQYDSANKNCILNFLKCQVPQEYLMCIGKENQLFVVPYGGIASVGKPHKGLSQTECETMYREVVHEKVDLWKEMKGQLYALKTRASAKMTAYAYMLSDTSDYTEISLGENRESELLQDLYQLKELRKLRGKLNKTTKSLKRRDRSQPVTKDVAEIYDRIENLEKVLVRYKRKFNKLQRRPDDYHWKEFLTVMNVLKKCDALQDDLKPTNLGMIARELRGDHELWLAIVLTQPQLGSLTPAQLAAVLGAYMAGPMFVFKSDIQSPYEISDKIKETLLALEDPMNRILDIQEEVKLDRPILVDERLCGIIEAWVLGQSWEAIIAECTVDEGDIARVLMRTIDFLKQVVHIEEVWEEVRQNCKEALKGMDRSPVAEIYI